MTNSLTNPISSQLVELALLSSRRGRSSEPEKNRFFKSFGGISRARNWQRETAASSGLNHSRDTETPRSVRVEMKNRCEGAGQGREEGEKTNSIDRENASTDKSNADSSARVVVQARALQALTREREGGGGKGLM